MNGGAPMTMSERPDAQAHLRWLVPLLGFAAMYGPVYWWASHDIWQSEEHGHGPLILGVLAWLFWTLREPLAKAECRPQPGWGWPVFVFGVLLYIAGRVLSISVFEFGSQMFVVVGGMLLLKGTSALKVAWFPVLYLAFMIPLPGVLVDNITGPLKAWVSALVVDLLFHAGYPIGRSGVMITIGQYQLLVADACSGLNSMFSLSALGTLFMYIMARKSKLHNAIMLASIFPIAFAANIIRVIVLVLVTYHLGDEAGQGFLHGAAGMVLMLAALIIFFMLDALLLTMGRVFGRRRSTSP